MKKKLLHFLLLILFNSVQAQTYNWVGAIRTGDFDDDRGTSITTDAFGNVYATGYYASPTITFGTHVLTNTNSGSYDMFLVKYDPAGNVIWARNEGGSGFDYSNSVTTDTSGNVFIAGNFRSTTITFGSTTLTSAGVYDLFIAKYDSAGIVQWAKRAGGTNDEECTGVTTDEAGNAYITGKFTSSSITFGSTTLTNAQTNNADLFVTKYSPSGNVQWAKRAGGTNGDYGYGIATDVSGNVLVTGCFGSAGISFGSTTLTNAGVGATFDVFLTKYDSLGTVLWAKRAGGTGDDQSNAICTDVSGYPYITGFFTSTSANFGSSTITNTGLQDVFTAQYDPSGNVVWAHSAGGSGYEDGTDLIVAPNGDIFVTGYYDSPALGFGMSSLSNASGSNDVLVLKYNVLGTALWAETAGGAFTDQGSNMTFDNGGNVLIIGTFSSTSITFGPDTLNNSGGNDVFIANILSINPAMNIEHDVVKNDASVFPNPSNGNFTVMLNAAEIQSDAEMIIYDMTGKIVFATLLNGQEASQINITSVDAGVYLYEVKNGERSIAQGKLVLE